MRKKYLRKDSDIIELDLYYTPDIWSVENVCEKVPVVCTVHPYGPRWRLEKVVIPDNNFPDPSENTTTLCEVLWDALDKKGYTVTPRGYKMLNLLVSKEFNRGSF